MKNKNIITVWYLDNRTDIEIEDKNKREQCFLKEDINDKMVERIYSMCSIIWDNTKNNNSETE